jgi:Tol biopolymer transport system component
VLEASPTIAAPVDVPAATPIQESTPTKSAIPEAPVVASTGSSAKAPTPTPTAVPELIQASFSVDVESGSAPLLVEFNDNSRGAATSHIWDFGDGATSSDEDPSHLYTKADTYTVTLTVSGADGSDTMLVPDLITVEPGTPVSLDISPPTARLAVQEVTQCTAEARDEFENIVLGPVSWTAVSDAGTIDANGNFTAGVHAGSFDDEIIVSIPGDSTELMSFASVIIEPGELDRVTLDAIAPVQPDSQSQLAARVYDEFDNPLTDPNVSITFTADKVAGMVSASGVFAAATRAGLYENALTVDVVHGDVARSTSIDVIIIHGALDHVAVIPDSVNVEVGSFQRFNASGYDAHGNSIPDAVISWQIQEDAGVINADGEATISTEAGEFTDSVTATARLGSDSASAKASVIVKPSSLHSVRLSDSIELSAGGSPAQIEAIVTDEYGNLLTDVAIAWESVDGTPGSLSPQGLFTPGNVAGVFSGAILVTANQGEVALVATTTVTVSPGAVEKVYIAPTDLSIGMEMRQRFVAVGSDEFGNRMSDVRVNWIVDAEAGVIDVTGQFTASTTPGNYTVEAKVNGLGESDAISANSSVTVEPDRLAFISNRNDNQLDIYVMHFVDTSVITLERLTSTGAFSPNWSPDGRRIVFDEFQTFGTILETIANGELTLPIVFKPYPVFNASWSPDGTKLAFACQPETTLALCISDADGGNVVVLFEPDTESYPQWSPDGQEIGFTWNNRLYVIKADGSANRTLIGQGTMAFFEGENVEGPSRQLFPSWSPDGTEVLFQGVVGEFGPWAIYIVDTNGGVTQLTSRDASNNCPSWSLDGNRIAFHSFRDSTRARIFVMDRNGGNVAPLTDSSSDSYCPKWAPRKAGVEVTEASVIIPSTRTLSPLTVKEVTDNSRTAIVRIETEFIDPEGEGKGTGFIIDADGLILTNNHVISDTSKISVNLEDGSSYPAQVVGRDMVRDIALLKIEASGLPTLEIADSGHLEVGSDVVAMGFPLSFDGVAFTTGNVATIRRDTGRNVLWVWMDAIINPGNSGGPLLDMEGKVVGVVSLGVVGNVSDEGGAAISIATLRQYLDRLKSGEIINS